VRVRAVVAYDGTGYGGFQRQVNAPTIQEALERALSEILQTPTRLLAAGRTDAGVHAEGQVIAFDAAWQHPVENLQRALNALLPAQIAVLSLAEATAGFHPRYDALRRWYRYTLYCAPVRNPLVSRYSLHVRKPLAVADMQRAARQLLGQHDFAAFGSPPQGERTVREIFRAAWQVEEPWLTFDIEANAFLYRMVRMLVGTMLRVGFGALTPDDFGEILHSRERRRAGPAVAAAGLTLKAVYYAEEQAQ